MRTFGIFNRTAVVALAACCLSQSASSQDQITIALPTTATLFAPFYIAESAGLYKKHNLDVSLRVVQGPGAANAVVSGSADFSSSSGLTLLRALSKKAPLVAIGETAKDLDVRVVVTPKALAEMKVTIDTPFAQRVAALRGRTIAVDAVSGIPDGVLTYILDRGRLKRGDLRVTPMQPDAMLAALQSNAIDGIAFLTPTTIQAELAGNKLLIRAPQNERDLAGLSPFPFNLVITRNDYCQKRRSVCERFLNSLKEAQTYMMTRKSESLQILQSRFPTLAPEVVEQSLQAMINASNPSLAISEMALKSAQNLGLQAGFMQNADLVPLNSAYTNDFNK